MTYSTHTIHLEPTDTAAIDRSNMHCVALTVSDAAEKAADRCGITLARRALHREFPGITERHAVDQALANGLVIR